LVDVSDGCVLSSVPLGDATRTHSVRALGSKSRVALRKLGELANDNGIAAFERTELPSGSSVLVVRWDREVKSGQTDVYARIVTVHERRMVAGERFQIGRDAYQPPRFFGTFDKQTVHGAPVLILTQEGAGCEPARISFRQGADGAFRSDAPRTPRPPSASTSGQLRAKISVPFDDATDPKSYIAGCGPGGAYRQLTSTPCSDGSPARVERIADSTIRSAGVALERYLVTCAAGNEQAQKVLFAHPKLCM